MLIGGVHITGYSVGREEPRLPLFWSALIWLALALGLWALAAFVFAGVVPAGNALINFVSTNISIQPR